MLTSIRNKATLALIAITLVAVLIVGIGWQAMRLSETALSEFEAQTLPEISTALTLAEGVAQLAANAPYTAESGRPFQLQSEAEKIHRRIQELQSVADSLQDQSFRKAIFTRLDILQNTLEELVALVEEELFIREDSLALQFEIRVMAGESTSQSQAVAVSQVLGWLLGLIEQPERTPPAMVKDTDLMAQLSGRPLQITQGLLQAHRRLAEIALRKDYLLISIRAKSEQLSSQVSLFVGGLQKQVSNQRRRVSEVISYGQMWTAAISLLLLIGLTRLYLYSRALTRDLGNVTEEMERLSLGEVHAQPLALNRHDEIGVLARTFEVFRRDAVRRIEVTAELSEQKRLLETIFNSMNDGLSVFSAEGRLMAWNQRYLDLFGLAAGSLRLGMTLQEVQPLIASSSHENRSVSEQPLLMEEVNRSRFHQGQSFERHFDSGQVVEFRSQPMPEGGFVTLYTDLTERKNIEQQLRQAQKMELLGQLTGGVAHDFNNLLAAISGNLQLLQELGVSDKQGKYLERALAVSEKSASLVQRLLAFSRRQQLNPEAVNMDDLVEGMLDLVEYSVGNKIEVRTDLQCADALCLIDPSQLENALLNLALNSAAAMPEGGQLSFLTQYGLLADQIPAIVIRVQDTGNGIPKELIPRVVEPFFTTKPVGKGSGLGLSMIYGFVKQSGGEMEIRSEVGSGTEIILTLPLIQTIPEPSFDQDLHDTFRFQLAEQASVWLVEDDIEVQQVLAEQLCSLGLQVRTFQDAESLFPALSSDERPALILSDVNLAGAMDGVRMAHQLKASDPHCQVLLMSGLPADQLQRQYGLQHSDAFLAKPFSLNQLAYRLGR